jgi:hypothetical protein
MNIFQIRIDVARYRPKIWRRLLVRSDLPLYDFHMTIQIAMGWENSHLHQFIKGKKFYSERLADDWTWDDLSNIDYEGMIISDLLEKAKDKIEYEYDFGDGWIHDVILEKVLLPDETMKAPVCIDGALACPPEDCGGIWGYASMLEILKDPGHEQYEETLEWVGETFNPEFFDIEAVNKLLKKHIKYRKSSAKP